MSTQSDWRTGETLAWTDHDGPERPPRGPHIAFNLALSTVLAAVFTGMVLTDTLCPEHRAWVQGLGSVALFGCVASAVALARGWAMGPVVAMGTTMIGVVIGAIDAVHSGARGWLIAACFAAAWLGAVWLTLQQAESRRWARRHLDGELDDPLADHVTASVDPTGSAPSAAAPRGGVEAR